MLKIWLPLLKPSFVPIPSILSIPKLGGPPFRLLGNPLYRLTQNYGNAPIPFEEILEFTVFGKKVEESPGEFPVQVNLDNLKLSETSQTPGAVEFKPNIWFPRFNSNPDQTLSGTLRTELGSLHSSDKILNF
ncbi:hypothetical protein OUZ56_011541 [Daphnia magna]|uniref:Uncharacterized protein n=1 Tax=Daphnia magna TaxID=35525 RepID=A0ABQ9Z0G6_9CRUS|nr:hypothetical protein OUZ56_011541 [Daphnia magna]